MVRFILSVGSLVFYKQRRIGICRNRYLEYTGTLDDNTTLEEGGYGATAYAQAICVYLGFGLSRLTDICNSFCRWEVTKTQVRNLFGRQAIPMIWDYAENNVFAGAAGDYMTSLNSIVKVIQRFQSTNLGIVRQFDAQSDIL